MTHADIHAGSRILHLNVSHGSDQYDIPFQMERPPLVRDLMQELEKRCHVPMANQQVFYRGVRLHESPDKQLNQFGIFNGNYIQLVGERLSATDSELSRHLASLENDVRANDALLARICNELENLTQRQPPRNQCEPLLRDIEHCAANLQASLSMLTNMNVSPTRSDAYRRQNELHAFIRDRLDIAANVRAAIASAGAQLAGSDHYLSYRN